MNCGLCGDDQRCRIVTVSAQQHVKTTNLRYTSSGTAWTEHYQVVSRNEGPVCRRCTWRIFFKACLTIIAVAGSFFLLGFGGYRLAETMGAGKENLVFAWVFKIIFNVVGSLIAVCGVFGLVEDFMLDELMRMFPEQKQYHNRGGYRVLYRFERGPIARRILRLFPKLDEDSL